ncbi:DedA family protein [Rhodopila sp.]|uniref:DedA family protein n=1 Tax=Rhodopila sp. TaxID=2480087 RepID=UPI003D0A1F50
MALESACIPLPSEIIMPFAGYLVSTGRFSLFLAATAGAVGCNIGSAIAFEVGARGGRPLVERWGTRLLLNPSEIEWADRWFERYGSITVLIGRLLPIVRTFIALPAGIARMNRVRFHVYTFVGSWFWCLALAYIGMKLGERWDSDPRLKAWMHRFDLVIVAAIVVAIGAFLWHRLRHRRH